MRNPLAGLAAPPELLQCPNCGSGVGHGLDLETLLCSGCNTQYFSLGGVPCLFPAGEYHKTIWQHQAAIMQAQGQQGLAQVEEAVSRYDMTARTRERLVDTFSALDASQAIILQLLARAGVEPKLSEGMGHAGNLSEYYDVILRDWAWPGTENSQALERVLVCLPENFRAQRILVLGAGAGRLSWDLHCHLKPECTVALDSNPLLLVVADTLVRKRQAIELAEFKAFPQINKAVTQTWSLQPPQDPTELNTSWFALGANAWCAPLQSHSFDLIVTPWFIDVNGGDVRDTIGVVSHLLAPGGRWLNTGPLLFSRQLPLEQKYQDKEIREFLDLSGFSMEAESISEVDHLESPLDVRKQHEQLWTFCAKGPKQTPTSALELGELPPWLIMHHLPVSKYPYATAQQHPLIDAILALIDGQNSINDIAAQIAPQMPEGITPKDAVVTLLGQILAEMAEAEE